MIKTTKMLLIEERAKRDIRDVLREAYAEGGSIKRASAIITERYAPVSFGIYSDWVEQLGGRIRSEVEFPCAEVA